MALQVKSYYAYLVLITVLGAATSFKERNNLKSHNSPHHAADTSIIAHYSFDTHIGKWDEKSECCSWSGLIERSIKRAGTGSLKVELRKDDSVYGHRSELGQAPNTRKEGWFGFSLFFPPDFIKDSIEESIVQWQSLPDFAMGESWRSAPLLLGVLNDRFVLEIRTDSSKVTQQGNYNFTRIDLGPVDKNQWGDWVFHIKWAYDTTGIIEVWKNNKLIVSRINKPNSYNDTHYPYFKIGIYKWGWSNAPSTVIKSRIIYIDEVTIGHGGAGYKKVHPLRARNADSGMLLK